MNNFVIVNGVLFFFVGSIFLAKLGLDLKATIMQKSTLFAGRVTFIFNKI